MVHDTYMCVCVCVCVCVLLCDEWRPDYTRISLHYLAPTSSLSVYVCVCAHITSHSSPSSPSLSCPTLANMSASSLSSRIRFALALCSSPNVKEGRE